MLYIDYLAHHNNLKSAALFEKLLLAGGGLVLALASSSPMTPAIIFIIMHAVMLYAGIPTRYILTLWAVPLPFVITSVITLITSIGTEPGMYLAKVQVGSYYLGITGAGLDTAALVCVRSVAALSCMYVLAVTTPISHITAYGARVKGLAGVMEITLLTYRFIFVVIETAGEIYTAQQSRLGYSSWRSAMHSISLLAANVGRKSFLVSQQLSTAMQARNYKETLIYRLPNQTIAFSRVAITLVLLSFAALFL